ncbi:MAG TPA: hypothetical protein V6C58_24515 [Allocoleopsis sp.]
MPFEAPEIEISSNAGEPSDIRNITGSISLPTGASTAARQDTGNASLGSIDSKLNTLGQKTSALSTPVVVSSDQPAYPVNAQVDETDSYTPATPYNFVQKGNLKTDPDGQLITRGDVLTDEGSFRDDFSGGSLSLDWTESVTGSATVSVLNSLLTLSTSTANGNKAIVFREGDYGPLSCVSQFLISQRIANQTIIFGLKDDFVNHNFGAFFEFTGTNNTQVTCKSFSSSDASDLETTIATLPQNLTTSTSNIYEINVQSDQVSFLINNIIVASHKLHIPSPYDVLNPGYLVENTGVATNTNLVIDFVWFTNVNQLEIRNNFEASPVGVVVKEDTHTLTGIITTTTTTADQIVIQTTIPQGRNCYITGYSITSSNVAANVVKVGINTITTETIGGAVDGNIFRAFNLLQQQYRDIDFSVPKKIGRGGDVLKLTVTPAGSQTTIWRASIDYILR